MQGHFEKNYSLLAKSSSFDHFLPTDIITFLLF